MAELAVVRRYASALLDVAIQQNKLDQVEADLKGVDQVLRTVPQLQRALRIPTVSSRRKKELLRTAFAARVDALSQRFLELIVERRRETVLTDIYAEFHRLANEHRNILPVQVWSATPLTDAEREGLAAALSQRTGKKIVLEVALDPAIMGGLVVRMGDTIIDGSVRTRLAQLRNRLLAGAPLLPTASSNGKSG